MDIPRQLDIFIDSREVMLRNDVIAALRARDPAAARRALAQLAGECRDEPLLPALTRLGEALETPARIADHAAAGAAIGHLETIVGPAAREVFRDDHIAWLTPFWRDLAGAAAHLEFHPAAEHAHAAPLSLRAGDWAAAAAATATIAAWRRQPAPLAWMAEARAQDAPAGAWPLLFELAWLAPARAEALARRLRMPPLAPLLQRFDGEFESPGEAADFAWFPAWAAIAEPALTAGLRETAAGSGSAPERCARLMPELLSLERQGRHAELVAARKKLHAAHPGLFAFYMQSR